MKKILSTLLILASILHAQIGIGRNLEGVRVPTANTLEQGFLFISGSYETINDGHALAMNGYSPAGTDSIYELDKNTPSSGGAISFAFGVTDNFEFGASLPLYYEGEIEGTDLDGFGIGDFLAYLKYSYPIPTTPVNVGFLIEAAAPTGAKGIGFRPGTSGISTRTRIPTPLRRASGRSSSKVSSRSTSTTSSTGTRTWATCM